MVPDEEARPSSEQSQSAPLKGRRRSRRGGRRHSRGRAPRPDPAVSGERVDAAADPGQPQEEGAPTGQPQSIADIESSRREQQRDQRPPRDDRQPREDRPPREERAPREERRAEREERPERELGPKVPAITEAIGQVNEIIEELRHALDEMEEVLETLEFAERQKIDDEREIESLQRALRQLRQPGPRSQRSSEQRAPEQRSPEPPQH